MIEYFEKGSVQSTKFKLKDGKPITLPNNIVLFQRGNQLFFPKGDNNNEILCPGAEAETINTERTTWIFSLTPSKRKQILFELKMRSKNSKARIEINFGYGDRLRWKP